MVGGFGRATLMVAGGGGSVWPAGGTGRSRLPPPDTRRRRVGGAGALNPLALLPAGEEQLEFANLALGWAITAFLVLRARFCFGLVAVHEKQLFLLLAKNNNPFFWYMLKCHFFLFWP